MTTMTLPGAETRTIPIDIGITEMDRAAIASGLSRLLADSYTLYLKTHNFHWNVTGPMFQTLHLMFEQQYIERLVTLGHEDTRARFDEIREFLGDAASGRLSQAG